MISYVNPALFTETLLRDSSIENHLNISGCHQERMSYRSFSLGTISLQGTVLQALTVESACILKTTPGSSPWNIYRILILKQCGRGRGFSRPDYRVESRVGLLALSTTWPCLNIYRQLQHQFEVNFRAAAFSYVATLKGFNIRRLRSHFI